MPGIVMQLQEAALDRTVSVTDLLRKALVAAIKLGRPDIEAWIHHELDGYPNESDFPAYRKIRGVVKAKNPLQGGWIQVLFQSPEDAEAVSVRPCNQRVAEIEHLFAGGARSTFEMPFSPSMQAEMQKGLNYPAPVTLFVSSASLAGVLDEVRNVILKWAMDLESAGVLGEGLSFSPREQHGAAALSINNYFYGSVQGSTIQQGLGSLWQTVQVDNGLGEIRTLLEELSRSLDALVLNAKDRAEVQADIASVETQLASPRPKPGILREGLISVRRFLEGAGGKLGPIGEHDWERRCRSLARCRQGAFERVAPAIVGLTDQEEWRLIAAALDALEGNGPGVRHRSRPPVGGGE